LRPAELIDRGALLTDYLERIAVLFVEIPPLRKRMEDLPTLVDALLERAGYQSSFERSFSNDARKKMLDYDWPGNVRELDVVIQRVCPFTGNGRVEVEHIERNADIPWFAGVYSLDREAAAVHIEKPKRTRRSNKYQTDDVGRARKMRKEGATLAQITKETGMPRSTAAELTR
jgi:DNA-binding NtrC family response regulator